MILGFLGKGGSGKSTVSTQMTLYLNSLDKYKVYAIDADHNMDMSYNLTNGKIPEMNYLGDSLADFQQAVNIDSSQKTTEAFLDDISKRFRLEPMSKEVEKYSHTLASGITLMAAGPQTDTVMYGQSCSHILTTPLKILLPLLEIKEDEMVIIDEKAGADGVTTGIVTGIDVGVIVCEPAIHSVKTALQIAKLMDFYETPYIFVGNKIINNDDKQYIKSKLPNFNLHFVPMSKSLKLEPSQQTNNWQSSLQELIANAFELNQNNRLERTIIKSKRNHNYMKN